LVPTEFVLTPEMQKMIHELTENVAKALETVIPPPTQTEKDHAGKLAAMEAKMEETLARLAQMEKEYARFVQLEKELQNLKNEKKRRTTKTKNSERS